MPLVRSEKRTPPLARLSLEPPALRVRDARKEVAMNVADREEITLGVDVHHATGTRG